METPTRPSYFRNWSSEDMKKAFFEALGRYIKNKTNEDLDIMYYAWLWAMHADHEASKAFREATDWAKIDIFEDDWQRHEKRKNT